MKFYLILSFFFIVKITQAVTYSGVVKNQKNNEVIIGCVVYLKGVPSISTSTDINGFYTIDVGQHEDTLVFLSMSFKPREYSISPSSKDIVLNVSLNKEEVGIDLVEINELKNENTKSVDMSTIELDMKDVKKLPAFMGEVDVLKTIQLMPGVQSGGEGNSGFYVRGGGPDQNLILLDGATVYNASHLFGFFSVFNADAIKNIKLTKGGMPANFGGRLSSILEVNMNEGNLKKIEYRLFTPCRNNHFI